MLFSPQVNFELQLALGVRVCPERLQASERLLAQSCLNFICFNSARRLEGEVMRHKISCERIPIHLFELLWIPRFLQNEIWNPPAHPLWSSVVLCQCEHFYPRFHKFHILVLVFSV